MNYKEEPVPTDSQPHTTDSTGRLSFLGARTRPVLFAFTMMVVITGCFSAASAMRNQNAEAGNETNATLKNIDQGEFSNESTLNEDVAADTNESNDNPQAAGVTSEGASNSSASTHIKIDAHSQTTVNGETVTSEPEVIINGESVDLPDHGSYRQDIRDDDSHTRIRARVDADNTTLNISTNESVDSGSD